MYEKLKDILKNYPKRSALGFGLLGVIGTTSFNNNVHYGSAKLENPSGNHYVWGIFPNLEVSGDIDGNFRNYGLVGSSVRVTGDSILGGNVASYSLIFSVSAVEPQSRIKGDISNYAIFRANGHNDDFLNFGR